VPKINIKYLNYRKVKLSFVVYCVMLKVLMVVTVKVTISFDTTPADGLELTQVSSRDIGASLIHEETTVCSTVFVNK
jgi:hypothetical protein